MQDPTTPDADDTAEIAPLLPLLQEFSARLRAECKDYVRLQAWQRGAFVPPVAVLVATVAVVPAVLVSSFTTVHLLLEAPLLLFTASAVLAYAYFLTSRPKQTLARKTILALATGTDRVCRLALHLRDRRALSASEALILDLRLADARSALELVALVLRTPSLFPEEVPENFRAPGMPRTSDEHAESALGAATV